MNSMNPKKGSAQCLDHYSTLYPVLLAPSFGPLMIAALTLVRRETADFGSTMVGGRMPPAVPHEIEHQRKQPHGKVTWCLQIFTSLMLTPGLCWSADQGVSNLDSGTL